MECSLGVAKSESLLGSLHLPQVESAEQVLDGACDAGRGAARVAAAQHLHDGHAVLQRRLPHHLVPPHHALGTHAQQPKRISCTNGTVSSAPRMRGRQLVAAGAMQECSLVGSPRLHSAETRPALRGLSQLTLQDVGPRIVDKQVGLEL